MSKDKKSSARPPRSIPPQLMASLVSTMTNVALAKALEMGFKKLIENGGTISLTYDLPEVADENGNLPCAYCKSKADLSASRGTRNVAENSVSCSNELCHLFFAAWDPKDWNYRGEDPTPAAEESSEVAQ